MTKIRHFFFLIATLTLAFSCQPGADRTQDQKINPQELAESMEKANKYLLRKEQEQIENYVRRHGLNMQHTGSGLLYQIDREGIGELISKGQVVKLQYTTRFLTGDIVYSSATEGAKIFQVGKGGVETGLEEAILLLRKGAKAKIIIPSHLAFGLLGDQHKIPPRTVLVYEVEVVDVQ